jgi:hypothetical protein
MSVLKLSNTIRVLRDVVVHQPGEGSKVKPTTIRLEFELRSVTQEDEASEAVTTKPKRAPDMSDDEWDDVMRGYERRLRLYQYDKMRQVVVGWPPQAALLGEDDTPLLYSEEAKARLLDIPFVLTAVVAAYDKAIRGMKAGN